MEYAKARRTLHNSIIRCRILLENSLSEVLQGQYGIHPTGLIEDFSGNTHLNKEESKIRDNLIDYFYHINANIKNQQESVVQLVREIAFTHLNRFCALKVMEKRGFIRDAVSQGTQSQGFLFFLADHPELEHLTASGENEKPYREFIKSLVQSFEYELGTLFSQGDAGSQLFPPQRTIDQVLSLINAPELNDIWKYDDTIGWVYQFFTPKELRDQVRQESSAPRNSYELAFRNQFYTPRYVVEFLADNTLGRTWYEMRQGKSRLTDACKSLMHLPNEVWLKEGDAMPSPESAEEGQSTDPVYIDYRPIKDPREIRVLDPACGSGHFLLYCFNLLLIIYTEAWDECPSLLVDLRNQLTRDEYLSQIPGMILRYNLYGIDIDLRATQIASLALWLRAQRAYQELGLKRDQRPLITRANIVCAEPMPGDDGLQEDFLQNLNPPLVRQLFNVVFDKMKLAGEAGSLLKIEEDLRDAIQLAKHQVSLQPKIEQKAFWPIDEKPKQLAFDLSGIEKSDEEFWQTIELRVFDTLKAYTLQVSSDQGFKRRLFTEDIEHGFAFIDLFRKKYDVVLMNPPFGEVPSSISSYINVRYPTWNNNILCAFIERGWNLTAPRGFVGAIYDRTAIVKSTYEDFRRNVLVPDDRLYAMADLGWEVLDANVEVTTSILSHHAKNKKGVFIDVRDENVNEKDRYITNYITDINNYGISDKVVLEHGSKFQKLPNAVIGYDFPNFLRNAFTKSVSLEREGLKAYQGFALKAEKHFRVWWEISNNHEIVVNRMFNGAGFNPYITPLYDIAVSYVEPEDLPMDSSTRKSGLGSHRKKGVCFGKRGDYFCVDVLPSGHIFTVEGQSIPINDEDKALELLALLNTPLVRYSLNKYCGQHKYSGYVNLFPYRRLPNPFEVRSRISEVIESVRMAQRYDELQSSFSFFANNYSVHEYANEINSLIKKAWVYIQECEDYCQKQAVEAYEVGESERLVLDNFRKKQPKPAPPIGDVDVENDCLWWAAHSITSHIIGLIFGRWDIRIARNSEFLPKLQDPFDSLGEYPPAMMVTKNGLPANTGQIVSEHWLRARPDINTLPEIVENQVVCGNNILNPATIPDEEYPFLVAWDGILVDDNGHPNDIVTYSRKALEWLYSENSDAIEREACEILDSKSIRDYFSKPSTGGFWMDHIRRYSKSRRKAPIYWLLQSSNKNYAVWLYYHRLNKDILFKALTQYVEPKIRLEEDRLKSMRTDRGKFGTGGKQAKDLDNVIEQQEALLVELEEFRDKLRGAANLGLEPDLNDGVMLNIAPLWELVPWGEAKKYWEELLDGKYEWSSIGKQLRAKGKVK